MVLIAILVVWAKTNVVIGAALFGGIRRRRKQ